MKAFCDSTGHKGPMVEDGVNLLCRACGHMVARLSEPKVQSSQTFDSPAVSWAPISWTQQEFRRLVELMRIRGLMVFPESEQYRREMVSLSPIAVRRGWIKIAPIAEILKELDPNGADVPESGLAEGLAGCDQIVQPEKRAMRRRKNHEGGRVA